ncbi:MAG: hypothetical protein Q8P34_13655 [Bacteroidota bacterium]|nr:hypothetical protein [Bacteroidota bacterium]
MTTKKSLVLTLEEKASQEQHFNRFKLFLPDFLDAHEIFNTPLFSIFSGIGNATGHFQGKPIETHPGEGSLC